jgi:heterodisulfide reductase subunit A
MVEVSRHRNIDLFTYSEVKKVEGSAGSFLVNIWKRTKYVDPQKCTGCADCEKACPIEVVNEFDESLSKRKAIYIEFPQAVPLTYTIDYKNCIGCGACDRVCEAGAISFLEQSQEIEMEVGSIVVATGFEQLEPSIRGEYGYGKYKNVLTSLQYERLLSSSGPTQGKVLRPSDGKPPKRIAWIQCVGSRCQEQGFPYCSRVCCMYAIKEASITKEEDLTKEVYIFYMDLRAHGKDFQQYYEKAKKIGINYIRSRPAKVYENLDGSLKIKYEDTLTGEIKDLDVDLLVLSSAIIPSKDNPKLAKLLGIAVDEHGFFKAKDLLLDPTSSTQEGIYIAGCAQGPKDIPDSVAQASGAAAMALIPIKDRKRVKEVEKRKEIDVSKAEPRIGVFVCNCGKNIGGFLDVAEVAEYAKHLPNVSWVEEDMFTCSEDTQKKIKQAIADYKLNRIIVAACSPRTHASLFQDTIEEAGLNRYLFEMANIRNQCSWVHSYERERATKKAKDLVRMAVAKASLLTPLKESEIKVKQEALVIGGGVAGMRTALSLAEIGVKVYLIEREPELGGKLRDLYKLFPSDIEAKEILNKLIEKVRESKNIKIYTNCEIRQIDGYIGNWEIEFTNGKHAVASTVIIATGFKEIEPAGFYGYEKSERIVTQLELERALREGRIDKHAKHIVFINCVGALSEPRPWCCRIGCGNSLKNAKFLKEKLPDASIWVLYKDMRVFGKEEEEYYLDVQKQGVIFIRYEQEPKVSVEDKIKVEVFDTLLDEPLEIEADLLVLTPQLEGDSSVAELKRMLKVSADPGNFYQEAHVKLRPLDFPTDGVYVCGSAHYPKNLTDAISQAEGAASRAAIPMLKGFAKSEGIIASVDEDLCSGCKLCIAVCPYSAIEFDEEKKVVRINEVLCKGCGTCSAACPCGALQQEGFSDKQISSMVEAAFEVS